MEFCTITPTRNDRPQLLAFCKHQLDRMTVKPNKSYFVDYEPTTIGVDIRDRFRIGIDMARKDGFEYCFIVEDDDYYPADYFERITSQGDFDIIGDAYTMYYHLWTNGYHEQHHRNRASLFTTGFKISQIVKAPLPNNPFIDIALWEYARNKHLKAKLIRTGAIGIKHGIGKCAGIGHRQRYHVFDKGWKILAERVDDQALDFYKSIKKS